MDRKRAKELLPIIQAFADGKDVEFSNRDGDWESFVVGEDSFNLSFDNKWRIKPEPREWYVALDTGDPYECTAFSNMPDPAIGDVVHVREVIE